MKKMRKILSALLAMSMVFTLLAVSASAATPNTESEYGSEMILRSATNPTQVSLNLPMTSYTFPFLINEGFNYWKIQIQTSNPKMRFFITKDSPQGATVYTPDLSSSNGYLPLGNSPFYDKLDAGTYYVTVYVAGGGTNLQGILWYKTASTRAELEN